MRRCHSTSRFRRRSTRRRSGYSRKGAGKKYSIRRRVKYAPRRTPRGFLGAAGEVRYFDAPSGTAGGILTVACNTAGAAAAVTHLDVIPQGTTVNQRIGKAWNISAVHIRGQIKAKTTSILQVARIYLIWDFQPNKVLATVTDILDAAHSSSFLKRENVQRFRVLWSQAYNLIGNNTGVAGTATERTSMPIDKLILVPDPSGIAESTQADTTGAIGNRVSGALLLLCVGDQPSGTTEASYECVHRLFFNDIL